MENVTLNEQLFYNYCPEREKADNSETGAAGLAVAVLRKAYEDFKEIKKALNTEKQSAKFFEARRALRKMQKTFCNSNENELMNLYSFVIGYDAPAIWRTFEVNYNWGKTQSRRKVLTAVGKKELDSKEKFDAIEKYFEEYGDGNDILPHAKYLLETYAINENSIDFEEMYKKTVVYLFKKEA